MASQKKMFQFGIVLIIGIIIGVVINPYIFPGYDDGEYVLTGTGFFVSANGCIITNAHVVEGADSVLVSLPIDIPKEKGGDDIKRHSDHTYYKIGEILKVGSAEGGDWDGDGIDDDLALIKINNDDLVFFFDDDFNVIDTDIEFKPTPIILNTNTPQELDGAFTIGHPGMDIFDLGYWIPTSGWFSLINMDTNEYVFELATFPGNSGGPILNLDGELIGVVWGGSVAAFSDEEGDEITWGFPYNNMHLNEIYHTDMITWDNLGWFLFDTGAVDTFAERSTTVIEFLEGTPCNIETSSSIPIRFDEEEWDKEIEHMYEVFNRVKYQVVFIEEI